MKKKTKRASRIWRTSDGRVMNISDMDIDHLINSINLLEKLAHDKYLAIELLVPRNLPFRCVIPKGRAILQNLEGMDRAELANYFFPDKYKILLEELDKRNKERMSLLLETLKDQVVGLQEEVAGFADEILRSRKY